VEIIRKIIKYLKNAKEDFQYKVHILQGKLETQFDKEKRTQKTTMSIKEKKLWLTSQG